MVNPFYKNHGPVNITEILRILRLDDFKLSTDQDISDVKDLVMAKKNEITFLNSKKYENVAKNTKASYCITLKNLNHICQNVPVSTAEDMMKGVLDYLEGRTDFAPTTRVRQNNKKQDVETEDGSEISNTLELDAFFNLHS